MTATGVAGDPDDVAADPAALVPMSAEQDNLPALADRLTVDAIEKIDAGAQLVYALYYAGTDFWARPDLPPGLIKANVRAQAAYGVGRAGQKGD